MSRYYAIKITDPDSGEMIKPFGFEALDSTYTSFYNGKTLSNAWRVVIDVYITTFATPAGGSYVRVYGISLREISQANDLAGKNIQVFAGMQKGLPLANPAQAKMIFSGVIFQAFGNWIGTDMTLDLIVNPGIGDPTQPPQNVIHNWKKGTLLKDAINTTLMQAFQGYTADIQISDKLKFTQDDTGAYQSIVEFAQYIRSRSKDIIGGDNYNGVEITLTDKVFRVFDASTEAEPIMIDFKDLIGQPTWIESPTISTKMVMRGDITVGDFIKLPPGLVTTTGAARPSQINLSTAFQGSFLVKAIRHVGDSRQPDAASWCSIFEAIPTQQQSTNG